MGAQGLALCGGNYCDRQNTALFALLGVPMAAMASRPSPCRSARPRADEQRPASRGGQYYIEGQANGVEDVTLIQGQLPMHNHPFLANGALGDTPGPLNNYLAGAKAGSVGVNTYATPGATVPARARHARHDRGRTGP